MRMDDEVVKLIVNVSIEFHSSRKNKVLKFASATKFPVFSPREEFNES